MNSKNYSKQILELLDSKGNLGLDAREIAEKVIIKEDKEKNLKYIRQYLTRLRKRQKIYVRSINEYKEYVYCSIKWLIKLFEEMAFEDPDTSKLLEKDFIIGLMGYVKKEV